jgi:hypothetical protein
MARAIPEGPHGDRPAEPDRPLPERVELMRMAARHLHEAGIHDVGEEVDRRAEEMMHQMHQPSGGPHRPDEIHEMIQDIRRQMEQMRDQMMAMQEKMERLHRDRP